MANKMRRCQGPCGRNRSERFFVSRRGRVCADCLRKSRQSASRAQRLRNVYEIDPDEYAALLSAQDGRCAGCGGVRKYNLAVDHDHKIEKEFGTRASIRGLLCKRCNNLLRDAWDDPKVLRALADYLEDPPARAILRV